MTTHAPTAIIIPTPTQITIPAVADALSQLTKRAYDDDIRADLLKLQAKVDHRNTLVMQEAGSTLMDIIRIGTTVCMNADPGTITACLDEMYQAHHRFQDVAHQCIAKRLQMESLEPSQPTTTTIVEATESTGGTSTPASPQSRTSPKRQRHGKKKQKRKHRHANKNKRKRQTFTCYFCKSQDKTCFPRLTDDGKTFICLPCKQQQQTINGKSPFKPFGTKLWTSLEEEFVVTTIMTKYAKHLWSKPASMGRQEVSKRISRRMIKNGMKRTPKAVFKRMRTLGLTVDLPYENLNHSLRAQLVADGLIQAPIYGDAIVVSPCLDDDDDDSKDITMTNAQDTDDDIDDSDGATALARLDPSVNAKRARLRRFKQRHASD